MKRNLLLLFLILSICFHMLLFIIKIPQNQPVNQPIKIDIVQKEKPKDLNHVEPVPEKVPEKPQEVKPQTPPVKEIPNTPKPPAELPVVMDNVPPVMKGQVKGIPKNKPLPSTTTAKPEQHKQENYAENPPPPLNDEEFIKERAAAGKNDISMQEIIREYARANEHRATTGEDTVSFKDLDLKYDSYFFKFARNLYNEWHYPEDAGEKGQGGIVRVSFTILSDGLITNINILESSGYPSLDREVLRTLKTMSGVPLPETYALKSLHVNGYFIYSINGSYRLY